MLKVSRCLNVNRNLERAMHDAFSNASDYSELEDDFLFLANEGQVALVPSDEVP
jgi:hypothetical protein